MRVVDESGTWEVNGGVRLLVEPSELWLQENQPVVDPPIVEEPVDEEKAALCEAIIAMSGELDELKARLLIVEGGA